MKTLTRLIFPVFNDYSHFSLIHIPVTNTEQLGLAGTPSQQEADRKHISQRVKAQYYSAKQQDCFTKEATSEGMLSVSTFERWWSVDTRIV